MYIELMCMYVYEPFVEFSIDNVLSLIGRRTSRERDEVREVLVGHALQQFV